MLYVVSHFAPDIRVLEHLKIDSISRFPSSSVANRLSHGIGCPTAGLAFDKTVLDAIAPLVIQPARFPEAMLGDGFLNCDMSSLRRVRMACACRTPSYRIRKHFA